MKRATLAVLAGTLAIWMSGCATGEAPGDEASRDEAATPWIITGDTSSEATPSKVELDGASPAALQDTIQPRVVLSFLASCQAPKGAEGVGSVATHAWAHSCTQFNGLPGGFTEWRGQCSGNVSNCNGRIVCQSHCP